MTIIEADGACEGAATCEVKREVTLGGKKSWIRAEKDPQIRTGPCKNKEAQTAMHKNKDNKVVC